MELNRKYDLEAREIGGLYRQMEAKELIYDPYYQRNFVWSEEDQQDFIKTIQLGYPCPAIFLAVGKRDLDKHIVYTHVVDGQQRLKTIEIYLRNELKVDGKKFDEMEKNERESISSYKMPVVILKLDPENDVEQITEIFSRLNKTDYILNETEKRISKLPRNEFVLISRLFSGDLEIDESEELDKEEEYKKMFQENPFISEEFKEWAKKKDFSKIINFFEKNVYSIRQIKENYITKDIIDIIGSYINKKHHSRILVDDQINELTKEINENKNKIYDNFVSVIEIFEKIKFPPRGKLKNKGYLLARGNCFSFIVALLFEDNNLKYISIEELQKNINLFCENIPDDYSAAATNSVMDKKQREIRHKYLTEVIKKSII